MNKKQAVRLRRLSYKRATRHGDEAVSLLDKIVGRFKTRVDNEDALVAIHFHTRRWMPGSSKRIYKDLKKDFLAIPRPQRNNWIKTLETTNA